MPDELLVPERVEVVEAPSAPQAEETTHESGTTLSEYLESLLVTVILALFGTTFVVQAFKIPSPSMENTLLIGDHKFIFGGRGQWFDKYLPYRNLRRGDIIVFKYPYQDHPHFVKRVIGLPGDHLKIVDQQVYINAKPLNEPYVVHDPAAGYDPMNYTFPPPGNQLFIPPVQVEWAHEIRKYIQGDELVIPQCQYLAMGDNRDVSLDSRYWGFVPYENIIGRPMFLYWSFQQPRDEYTRTSIAERLQFLVTIVIHFFDQTRWSRMFHVVR